MSGNRADRAFVEVGAVTAPHGIDGSMRVYPTTDFPERLQTLQQVRVDRLDSERAVVGVRPHGMLMIVKLAGVTTREAAEALRGAKLLVPVDALPALPAGEFYWHELVGMTVTEWGSGRILGQLDRVIRTGARQDVFEVGRPGKPPLLIPALKSVVRRVDTAARVMEVELIPGLEELT